MRTLLSLKSRKLRLEHLEERQMLSVSPADFTRIHELYPDLNLDNYASYNFIEISST